MHLGVGRVWGMCVCVGGGVTPQHRAALRAVTCPFILCPLALVFVQVVYAVFASLILFFGTPFWHNHPAFIKKWEEQVWVGGGFWFEGTGTRLCAKITPPLSLFISVLRVACVGVAEAEPVSIHHIWRQCSPGRTVSLVPKVRAVQGTARSTC